MIKLRYLAAAAMAAGALLLTAATAGATTPTVDPTVDPSVSASVEVSVSTSASASASSSSSAPASTPPTSASPTSTPASSTPAQTTPPASVSSSPAASSSAPFVYEDCDAVEAALGRAILDTEPGYGPHLDTDGGGPDGIGCEHLGVVPSDASGGKLALTGIALPVVGASGVGLVLLGAGLLLWLRRRNRTEFVAE